MSDFLQDVRREIDARIEELRPLVSEAAQLEGALVALGAAPAPARRPRRAHAARATSKPRRARRSAPRGQTKGQILEHLGAHPGATAGDIAKALELNRNSVATRLAQLVKAGELAKAERGYTVAG
ncbi:MAG: winged helix-turn-helix domain-containing protein [Solirubrobacteraceae bacterium]